VKNLVKQKLRDGEIVKGCFLGFHSASLVEILGLSGFDFVVIDNEHGSFSWGEIEDMVRAAEIVNLTPIVRVAYGPSDIQKALDRGAMGIHVPMVSSKEDAENVVKKAKFPPLGERGTAYSVRSAKYGKNIGQAYLQESNEEILVAIHIETPQAVENIEEILSVRGIDVCFIGPTDLSVTMGYGKEGASHPQVQKAINDVLEKALSMGMPVGTLTGNAAGVKDRVQWGARYIAVGITPVLFSAFESIVKVEL
jgi:4-hydroxy-2-oxoheptanedioate aldolase